MMQTEIEKDETFLVSTECKLKWFGYGEWVEEADKISFQYRGYECLIERVFAPEPMQENSVFGGHLCGYVKIPDDHCYFKAKGSKMAILCHGGLTYNCIKDWGKEHWIGFDCAHWNDFMPSINNFKKKMEQSDRYMEEVLALYPQMQQVYKNMDFCTKQCTSIVDQLIEIQEEHRDKLNG